MFASCCQAGRTAGPMLGVIDGVEKWEVVCNVGCIPINNEYRDCICEVVVPKRGTSNTKPESLIISPLIEFYV